MGNNSDVRFDDNDKTKYIYLYIRTILTRKIGKLKTQSPTYRLKDNLENMFILLTHSTKYISQAVYEFNVFR